MSVHKYTREQVAFIYKNYLGVSSQELADIFNKKFKTDLHVRKIRAFKSNRKLKSGVSTRFHSEQIPFNKGKKYPGQINTGSFKKGQDAINKKPIGTERICSKDGYIVIKVQDEGRYQDRWKLKHRVVWEEANGPIPPGYRVKFLNGDRTDCRLENLMLISFSAMARFNQNDMETGDVDLTKTNVLIAEVISKQHQKAGRKNDKRKNNGDSADREK